jgi:hypothetical protein
MDWMFRIVKCAILCSSEITAMQNLIQWKRSNRKKEDSKQGGGRQSTRSQLLRLTLRKSGKTGLEDAANWFSAWKFRFSSCTDFRRLKQSIDKIMVAADDALGRSNGWIRLRVPNSIRSSVNCGVGSGCSRLAFDSMKLILGRSLHSGSLWLHGQK